MKPTRQHSADTYTLALYLSRKQVERSIRDSGHKLQSFSHAELTQLARAKLTPELVEEVQTRYASILSVAPKSSR